MRYIPHTQEDIEAMLKTIGAASVDELFDGVPENLRHRELLPLPAALPEPELRKELTELAQMNQSVSQRKNFLGGGAYHHYVPSVIAPLVKRGEFLTAYTPYQPEVSQGTLQAIFEFQTMVCELTGMEVANASNYDLSTACPEAIMMAARINNKKKVLVARSTNPQYRDVIRTYFHSLDFEIEEVNFGSDGRVDADDLNQKLDDSVCALLVQSPNFFGVIEDMKSLGSKTKDLPALFISATPDPLAFSFYSPAEAGADIAIAEGMSFGLGLNYGGPYLGLFATKQEYIRQMPGRIVGQTEDTKGRSGYVLTFSTREQHIRREKATSNICTNQGLCALMASIYLSLLGPAGLESLAKLNFSRRDLFETEIKKTTPNAVVFSAPKFNETVVKLDQSVAQKVIALGKDGFLPGIDLSSFYPELENHLLVCTTEMNQEVDIKMLASRLVGA
ncbi:MAG: aminomethyl-transferring glycine dehydrogenase subunit GcvPA [Deltaproteobacteria bacterium]|nr:aminomethyl-transferring glycine dehydrogenase subunit GcvPA [Deltaproteobacteria bacterium]